MTEDLKLLIELVTDIRDHEWKVTPLTASKINAYLARLKVDTSSSNSVLDLESYLPTGYSITAYPDDKCYVLMCDGRYISSYKSCAEAQSASRERCLAILALDKLCTISKSMIE